MNGSLESSGKSSPKMSNVQSQHLPSSRASPYQNSATSKHAMDAPVFAPQAQSYRHTNGSHTSYQPPVGAMGSFDRDTIATSSNQGLGMSPPAASAILIRRLPLKTTEDSLRSMVVWSKDFVEAEVMSPEVSDDTGFRSAILRFKSASGAQEAQRLLNGKPNISNDAQMIVELFHGSSPTLGRRYPSDGGGPNTLNGGPASSASSASSGGPTPRQSSRFNGTFQSMERISPPNGTSAYGSNELPNPESSAHYQSLFSPQSPIGNHLTTERSRVSGKTLINDSVDDDETGELLKDPVAYAENGSSSTQSRRATNPQIPIARMGSLSLNTGSATALSSFSNQAQMTPMQSATLSTPMSPTLMSNGGPPMQYQMGNQHYQRSNFPPVNPADQNPPCNTLYVGNLPIDTSEDELKAMFSKQRGYKRLCFRTKQNGPMCFVEFEDVSFATKALHELYGHPLHNSIKGGIRLSFSKNPLGVRSGQGPGAPGPSAPPGGMQGMNGMGSGGPGASFGAVNGPPPGLSAPPGLGPSRIQYGGMSPMNMNSGQYGGGAFAGSNGWNGPSYNGSLGGGNQNVSMNSATSGGNFPPAYMMGR